MNIMEKRRAMIADGIQNANDQQARAMELKSQYEDALSGAKDESRRMIEQAKEDAKKEYDRILKDADAEAAERKILVFDSLNASLGEGVSVMGAARLKEEGCSMEEIYDTLEGERDHINVYFTVDDLHHLQRGGRVSKTTAVVGSMINIKPLLRVTASGELKSDGTVRGRKKALKTLVTKMEQSLDTERFGRDRTVAIVHGDCLEDALAVKEQVNGLGFDHVVVNDVSPSIGTHAGPAAL